MTYSPWSLSVNVAEPVDGFITLPILSFPSVPVPSSRSVSLANSKDVGMSIVVLLCAFNTSVTDVPSSTATGAWFTAAI